MVMGRMEMPIPANMRFQEEADSPTDFRLTRPTTGVHMLRLEIVKT